MKQKTLEWAGPSGFYCSFCDGEPPETHSNLPIGFITLPSEPALNAAGRTSDHPFKDIRSARRTHQRSRRYPGRKYYGNKRRRPEKARHRVPAAPAAALKDAYKRIESQEWEGDWYAEWAHKADMERMDDMASYDLFGKNTDMFEGRDEGQIMSDEDFGSWARRRIAEMRRVKEYRMHRYGKPTSPSPLFILPHTMRNDLRPGRTSATVLTAPFAKPYETSLPTNLSDIRTHLTLVCALTPSENLKQRCQRHNRPALPIIQGYGWWGEYTWQWHRNMSGCWFLGYEHGCRGGCVGQCTCPCWGSMVDECYCEEYGVGTDWEVPAPDGVQTCSLVEWVKGKLRERMEGEDIVSKRQCVRVEGERSLDQLRKTPATSLPYGWGWEADLGDEWTRGHYSDGEYIILETEQEESEAWSVVSRVDDGDFC